MVRLSNQLLIQLVQGLNVVCGEGYRHQQRLRVAGIDIVLYNV